MPLRPRDENAQPHRQDRAGNAAPEYDRAQMRQGQGQETALVVDRRGVILGQRREYEREESAAWR